MSVVPPLVFDFESAQLFYPAGATIRGLGVKATRVAESARLN